MNVYDIVALALLAWGAYKGFTKGFLSSLASLVALIAGIYAAWFFSGFARNFLLDNFEIKGELLGPSAFAITFLAVVIAISLLGGILSKIAEMASLDMVNRITGAAFGVLKGAVLVSTLLYIMTSLAPKDWNSSKVYHESVVCRPVAPIAPWLFNMVSKSEITKEVTPKDAAVE
jgi:membrane protein required for colicin V production